uniref:Man1/Src1-like C-terminal domain-containing protein n=1 Tax=Leersia perrieri TaxID=77586 RepID=A0A0D9VN68_9ORYZ
MPSRSAERRRRRWSLAEPPPGLFPTRDDLLRLLAVLSIAAAAAAACSLLNRRPKPFCDSDSDSDSTAHGAGTDSCQPCPHHGRCVHGNLECVQGFKKYGKICIEDGLISQTASKIFQELDMSNMADELLSKNFVGLSDDGVKVAKIRVLEIARGFFEKTFSYNGTEEFKCPELVAELYRPLACQIRQWISRNIMSVIAFCFLVRLWHHHLSHAVCVKTAHLIIEPKFSALLWILWSIYKRQTLSKRAEQIYDQVCEVLEDNVINAKIGNSECEPWVVTSWLRDHLLVPQERRNAFLWKKVEELIMEDSRIDQYPKVIKGESKVVYEWQASGSLSGKNKKKMQGKARGNAAGGGIKLAEELGAG